jgi:predicted RNA-binding Zn-ribbon protein involved in translation (DUF1610 family)
MDDTPRLESRTVDHVRTVTCPACGRDVELPRQAPWLIHGSGQYTPKLVAFTCPNCTHEIKL